MKLTIKLFATLREGRGKIIDMEVEEGVTIRQVTEELKITEEDVAILLRNGRDATLDDRPAEGDTLSIFPPVGGG
ncbi:MoaD/ThiS family protein [Alkalibacter rhizosphaerae]|uniref:MoaD/ThiS family protein n=1 Tax=Alkalibacter rhizosphaerae TaxID=2815577 RepID=A0A974XFI2_9FIRM|nr:MoaD/ThiS family protein [Alkalibacter rhizosphaerae]QSX07785.1 MoaD/ThiS family protein [Alkalibacter rhizosphaerae]